ncbi:MAG: hypothetical protein LBN25_02870 [Christensenellaceae bacterium]|jgi:hypothetical protein|nr:hypothetical protein [Christensenellaceae bacterium]
MKKKLVLLITAFVLGTLALVGCTFKGVDTSKNLGSPAVYFNNNGTIYWNAIANAVSYDIVLTLPKENGTKGGEVKIPVSVVYVAGDTLYYKIPQGGNGVFTASVTAKPQEGSQDHVAGKPTIIEFSFDATEVSSPAKLSTPSVEYANKTVTFADIDKAIAYQLVITSIDGGALGTTGTGENKREVTVIPVLITRGDTAYYDLTEQKYIFVIPGAVEGKNARISIYAVGNGATELSSDSKVVTIIL